MQFHSELLKLVTDYNETAGNPIEEICSHMVRHSGCTRNAEAGMDLKVLQYLMDHKTPKITNEVYNHVQVGRIKNAVQRVEEVRKTSV